MELSKPEEVIYEAIGHCYDRLKEYGQARSYYRKASNMNAEDSKLHYKIACTYFNEGQFLKAEPGVAKLLGVLSLQSLPRRLALDFRDVFQSGFAFDRIDGDAKITNGVAQTRNLRMRGVQALVLMEGQADLAQETQNLRVFVVPELNAGAASLAYAAINPA